MTETVPLILPPNQPPERPYRGGAGIRELRGAGAAGDRVPEDWVASTTSAFGTETLGLTVLADGGLLRDAIRDDPAGWLGDAHVARFGADPMLLVKILSTGERLFTHFHPDAAFARERFGLARGKTEAWLITSTGDAPSGTVWVGFARPVTTAELTGWFEAQDRENLLASLVAVEVRAGDTVHVPAGTPHAIGPGITLVELQEPSDLSLLLEYEGHPGLDRESALLGLTLDEALGGLATVPLGAAEVAVLHGSAGDGPRSTGVTRLLPGAADPFYRAERVVVGGGAGHDDTGHDDARHDDTVELDAGYSVLVVTEGRGTLDWGSGSLALTRGSVVLVPFGAGAVRLTGALTALRARPPV